MKVLALDTSTQMATVALFDNNILVAQSSIDNPKTHSQKLMPMLQHVMSSIDWSMRDIDLIGVGVGPGSFTGVRIAISVAKALSQPFNIPIVPISSLEAMCYSFDFFDGLICPMFDARRTQVYAGIYRNDKGHVFPIIEEKCILIADLLSQIEKNNGDNLLENNNNENDICVVGYDKQSNKISRKILFLGDGARKYQDEIVAKLGEMAVFAPSNLLMPMAASVGLCAIYADEEDYHRYDDIRANYLRRTEAEVNWEKQHAN